jgi:PncC family amidohydrolase
LLLQQNLTLAVAESCTGGLLAACITNISGSSAYFAGGVVAYSNEVKQQVLGVPADILVQHGAVSPETALAMARGVRELLQVDVALSVTGVAGPTGGTPEKPVGLVYIALASAEVEESRRFLWSGNRAENRHWSVEAALALLHEHLTLLGPQADQHAVPHHKAVPGSIRKEDEVDTEGTVVEVEARFEQAQHPTPLALKWQGQWLFVASIGRTWSTGRGSRLAHHYLVSTPGEKVFELAFDPGMVRWRVVRSWGRPAMA